MHRDLAATIVAAILALAACGDDRSSTESRSTTLPSSVPASAQISVASTTSSVRPATTVGVRTVALGQSFTVGVGQPVTVSGPGLTVTFAALVEDSRCPIGSRCIQAGRAVISLTVAKAGMAPATLAVSNEDPPSSRYGGTTIELVLLTRSEPRIATLRVT